MAPFATEASKDSAWDIREPNGTNRDRIHRLRQCESLYDEVAACPQAGIYERFLEMRARVLGHLEEEVFFCNNKLNKFLLDIDLKGERGVIDKNNEKLDEQIGNELRARMDELENLLHRHARAFKEARMMAVSPEPTQYLMDFARRFLCDINAGGRAPNGENLSRWGFEGSPVDASRFTTLNRQNLNLLEGLLAYKVVDPFLDCIYNPILRSWKQLRTGTQEHPPARRVQQLDLERVSAIAKVIVSMIAILSLAAAIGALDSIENSRIRMVVMTLFGLAFSWTAHSMGKDSMPTYNLITAYFQAMVIFVATSGNRVN